MHGGDNLLPMSSRQSSLARAALPALAELLGTALLVLGGVSSIAAVYARPWVPADWAGALKDFLVLAGFAASIAAIIYSPLGRLSGAQINPAVSLALCLRGRQAPARTLLLAASQCLGGILGAATAALLWGGRAMATVDHGATTLRPGVSLASGFVIEMLATAGLCQVILICQYSPLLRRWTGALAALYVWLAGTAFAPFTGSGFNPARSLGPALLAAQPGDLWLYLVAPLAGAALAALPGVALCRALLARPCRCCVACE